MKSEKTLEVKIQQTIQTNKNIKIANTQLNNQTGKVTEKIKMNKIQRQKTGNKIRIGKTKRGEYMSGIAEKHSFVKESGLMELDFIPLPQKQLVKTKVRMESAKVHSEYFFCLRGFETDIQACKLCTYY